MSEGEDKIEEINRKLNYLINCYEKLHNIMIGKFPNYEDHMKTRVDIWSNKIEGQLKNIIPQFDKISVLSPEIQEMRESNHDAWKSIASSQEKCHKWLGSHLYEIENRVAGIEKLLENNLQKIKIRVELEEPFSKIAESPSNIVQRITVPQFYKLLVDTKNKLSPREYNIIELRYGESGNEQTSYADIGRKIKLTRDRVSQIHLKALRKIRGLHLKKVFNAELLVPCMLKDSIIDHYEE